MTVLGAYLCETGCKYMTLEVHILIIGCDAVQCIKKLPAFRRNRLREHGGGRLLRNIGKLLPDYTASKPRGH